MENYKIYKFTFSDGKIYIGQTKEKIEDRWRNGEGYRGQDVYIPITLEGWENIKKEILHTNLTKDQAIRLERHYIIKFNSIKNGYNRALPRLNENNYNNVGKNALKLTYNNVSEEEKNTCQLYIIRSLTGRKGNLLKIMWYFILNEDNNLILSKSTVLENLNMQAAKYYEARNLLIELKWLEIKDNFLIIKYDNILAEIAKNKTYKEKNNA